MTALPGVRRRPLVGAIGAAAVVAISVSGCSAGQNAQTVEQTSVVDGTAFQAGAVALRDVGLRAPSGTSYAQGATAYLEGFVVNQNSVADELVSVSSPIASSVSFYPDGVTALLGNQPTSSSSASGSTGATSSGSGSATTSASPTDTASPSDTATGSASATASASASATGSATATGSSTSSTAAASTPLQSVELPTNQSIQFGYGNQQLAIVFSGLTRQLFPAETFPVTFTFARGGSVTATIAVKLPVDSSLQAPTINTSEGGE